MHVRDDDRVEPFDRDDFQQLADRAAAEIQHDPTIGGLGQVAGAGAPWARQGRTRADNAQGQGRDARTSCACSLTFTFGQTFKIRPAASIKNVARAFTPNAL
jgi:hypothetical protein